jgi:hypothetical protein
MIKYLKHLTGGDLRSTGNSSKVVKLVRTQKEFDDLFLFLFDSDRKVVMRAADAIEKITSDKPHFLIKHKLSLLELCNLSTEKELKWHLALLLSRFKLNNDELENVWELLSEWALDKNESKIVRVNSIQAMFELLVQNENYIEEYNRILFSLEKQKIPSINARIRKVRKLLKKKPVSN